jgi:hypothetical protein
MIERHVRMPQILGHGIFERLGSVVVKLRAIHIRKSGRRES